MSPLFVSKSWRLGRPLPSYFLGKQKNTWNFHPDFDPDVRLGTPLGTVGDRREETEQTSSLQNFVYNHFIYRLIIE